MRIRRHGAERSRVGVRAQGQDLIEEQSEDAEAVTRLAAALAQVKDAIARRIGEG
jgi:hypothetical protein